MSLVSILRLRAIMVQFRSTTTYSALLFAEDEPTLFASSGEVARAKEVMPWIKDRAPIPISDSGPWKDSSQNSRSEAGKAWFLRANP